MFIQYSIFNKSIELLVCTNAILVSRKSVVMKTNNVHDFINLYSYVCILQWGKTEKEFYYKIKKSTHTNDNRSYSKHYRNKKQCRGIEYDMIGKGLMLIVIVFIECLVCDRHSFKYIHVHIPT